MKKQEESNHDYEMLREAAAKLSTLVEAGPQGEEKRVISPKEKERFSEFGYLSEKSPSPEHPVETARSTFKTILEYLRRIHKKQGKAPWESSLAEGVQTIMLLVGEAAHQLDRYTTLFQKIHMGSITSLKEYKELQDFYHKTLIRQIHPQLTQFNPHLAKEEEIEAEVQSETPNLEELGGIDSVKEDKSYELFFLSKEDGSKFFSPKLIQKIYTSGQWREGSGETEADDPFVQIKNWEDKQLQLFATRLLHELQEPIAFFYHVSRRVKQMELVHWLNNALMALMLAANSHNLLRQFSVKSCSQYFQDFQGFLRTALYSSEYQKLIAKSPRKSQKFLSSLLEIIHGLCTALVSHNLPPIEACQGVQKLIEKADDSPQRDIKKHESLIGLGDYLESDFNALHRVLSQFPNGPLLKTFDLLWNHHPLSFDPFMLENLPYKLYQLDIQKKIISSLYLPSPTTQKMIQVAEVSEEFKGFLRSSKADVLPRHHLLINLQDRTSWKEHARCAALEDLQNHVEFFETLTVVTLAKETDFYYQLAPYQELDSAELFVQQFKDHLSSDQSGYYFPKKIAKVIFPHFIDRLLPLVHEHFFSTQALLSRRQRLDFIEVAYLFLELKLIEITRAETFSFTCKDGVDTAAASNVQCFIFLKQLNSQNLTERDMELIRTMLFAPALAVRERLINAERFKRMVSLIKLIEEEIKSQGPTFIEQVKQQFGGLFESSILKTNPTI